MARRITKIQYTDSNSIDGNRLEKSLSDVVDALNLVKSHDIKTNLMPFRIVGGWAPYNTTDADLDGVGSRYARGTAGPWGRANIAVNDLFPNPNPDKYRYKGLRIEDINTNIMGDHWVWTVRLATTRPILLDAVTLTLQCDDPAGAQYYANTFKWTKAPAGAAPSPQVDDYVKDVHILVDVLNPFYPEETDLSSVVVRKGDFPANAYLITNSTPDPGWQDMLPAFPITTFPFGLCIDVNNLVVEIPGSSIIRVAFCIPIYKLTAPEYTSWGSNPMSTCAVSWNITGLEAI